MANSEKFQMGDVHALRAINRVVTGNSNMQSAVVFMQAETSLQNFDDHRTLSALIGEWTSLPSTNLNRVFFVFSTDTYESLLKVSNDLRIPELRTAIQRKSSPNVNLKRIDSPEQDEIIRAISLVQQRNGLEVEETGFDRLLRAMVSEPRPCRIWLEKFSEIAKLWIGNLPDRLSFSLQPVTWVRVFGKELIV